MASGEPSQSGPSSRLTEGDRIEQNLAALQRRIDELRYQRGEIDAPPDTDEEGSPHQLPLPIALCMVLCGLVLVVAPGREERRLRGAD